MVVGGEVVVSTTTCGSTTISWDDLSDCDDLVDDEGSSVIVVRERLDPPWCSLLGYMDDPPPPPPPEEERLLLLPPTPLQLLRPLPPEVPERPPLELRLEDSPLLLLLPW